MLPRNFTPIFIICLGALCILPVSVPAEDDIGDRSTDRSMQLAKRSPLPAAPKTGPAASSKTGERLVPKPSASIGNGLGAIEATIINPFRSANVGTQVDGKIEEFHAEEGEKVEKGKPVVEIGKARYKLLLERAESTVERLRVAHGGAVRDHQLKKEMLNSDAITRQDLLRAENEVEMSAARLEEAKKDVELAGIDLRECVIKAPFTGYLAVRYKEPYEPVERLEKIFAIVDSSQVYAVANIGQKKLRNYTIGTSATFKDSSGRKFTGEVGKVGKLIDPKSGTKRVYVLIENSAGDLEIGMTGSLRLSK